MILKGIFCILEKLHQALFNSHLHNRGARAPNLIMRKYVI